LITGSLHFAGEVLAHLRGEPAAFEECGQWFSGGHFFRILSTNQSLCAHGSPSWQIPLFSARVCNTFSLGQRIIRHSDFVIGRVDGDKIAIVARWSVRAQH